MYKKSNNSNYYLHNFSSIVKRRNTVGIQFHPEKSQTNGSNLLSFLLNTQILKLF